MGTCTWIQRFSGGQLVERVKLRLSLKKSGDRKAWVGIKWAVDAEVLVKQLRLPGRKQPSERTEGGNLSSKFKRCRTPG